MSRNHTRLRVFTLADQLMLEVYRATIALPQAERCGLQAQVRRAALSTATNIVEGSARNTTKDYVHFLTLSLGSASEVRYLIDVANRLGLLPQETTAPLEQRSGELVRGLQKTITTLSERL